VKEGKLAISFTYSEILAAYWREEKTETEQTEKEAETGTEKGMTETSQEEAPTQILGTDMVQEIDEITLEKNETGIETKGSTESIETIETKESTGIDEKETVMRRDTVVTRIPTGLLRETQKSVEEIASVNRVQAPVTDEKQKGLVPLTRNPVLHLRQVRKCLLIKKAVVH
jgi:hypothetical protein